MEVIRHAWSLCQDGGAGSSPGGRNDTETGVATETLHIAWKKANDVGDNAAVSEYRGLIETTFGVSFESVDGAESWDLLRIRMVHVGLEMAAAALGDMARQMGLDWDDETAFRRIIGDIDLRLTKKVHSKGAYAEVYGPIITFYDNGYPYPDLLLHELGHVFNANTGLGDRDGSGAMNMTAHHPDTREGLGKADPETLRLFECARSDPRRRACQRGGVRSELSDIASATELGSHNE